MKKLLFLIIGIALVVLIAGCSSDSNDDSNETADSGDSVEYVTPGEVLTKIENEETFAFVLGDATCSACNHFKENALTEMKEKDGIVLPFIELYQIDEKEGQFEDLMTLIQNHLEDQFEATPTTYFMINGELEDVIIGVMPYEDLKETYQFYVLDNVEVEEDVEEDAETNEDTEEVEETESDSEETDEENKE